MTTVTSEEETETLKRQIRFLTNLINSSSGQLKITESRPRPATFSHLSTTSKYGKQEKFKHTGKTTEKSEIQGKPSSKFSWKKSSLYEKSKLLSKSGPTVAPDKDTITPHSLSSVHVLEASGVEKKMEANRSFLNIPISSEDVCNISNTHLTLFDKTGVDSFNGAKKNGHASQSNIDDFCRKNKQQLQKSLSLPSTSKSAPSGSEHFTTCSGQTDSTAGISKKLRNHPFMNRSKNSNQCTGNIGTDTTIKTEIDCKEIHNALNSSKSQDCNSLNVFNVCQTPVSLEVANSCLNDKTTAPISKDDAKSEKLTDVAPRNPVKMTSAKKLDGSPSKKKMTEIVAGKPVEMTSAKKPDGSPSKKKMTEQVAGKPVKMTSVKKPDGSPSKKKMTELVAGKPVKITSAKKPDGSPSKKEVLQELNRKLLETSNTILELRKQLSVKSGKYSVKNTETPKSSVKNESFHFDRKPTTSSSSSKIQHGQNFKKEISDTCKFQPKMDKHRLDTTSKENVDIKSKYSLEKTRPHTNELSKLKTEHTHAAVVNKPNINESSMFSSNLKNQQVPYKSKYKLRKNVISGKVSSKSTFPTVSANITPFSTSSNKTKIIKSKYHLRKVDISKSSKVHSVLPHLKKDLHVRQFQLPVFNSKYKLRKNMSKDRLSAFSPNISKTPATVKVIKSKYKLRKIAQNTFHTSKLKRTPMKTVVNSKYKLRKIPLSKTSYSVSSSNSIHKKRKQFYSNTIYSYRKNLTRWNHIRNIHDAHHRHGNRFKNYYYVNKYREYNKERRWMSHDSFNGSSRYQYKSDPRGYSNKAPLIISKRYVLKRLQNTRRVQSANTIEHTVKKMGDPTKVNLVVINGMLYKSSGHSLVKTSRQMTDKKNSIVIKKMNTTGMKIVKVRGVKFQIDSSGKTLKRLDSSPSLTGNLSTKSATKTAVHRVDFGGMTFVQTTPGTLEQLGSNQTKAMASRVKHRSIVTAAAKFKKDYTKKKITKKYCMFFNRFGKCQRGDNCPFVHDPEKVAVCTRFLRGTCKVDDCPFSHKVAKEKMPTCSYFLRGVCNRDNCPYRHVNVSKTAEVCQDFVKGFCSLGEKCTKKHTLICPSFSKTGICSERKPCKLKHIKKKPRYMSKEISGESSTREQDNSGLKRKVTETLEDSDISFKQRKLPTYISITSNVEDKQISEDLNNDSSAISQQYLGHLYRVSFCPWRGVLYSVEWLHPVDVKQVSVIKIRPQLGLK